MASRLAPMPHPPRDHRAALRAVRAGLLAVTAAVALSACTVTESPTDDPSGSDSGYELPEASLDGFTQVPLYFVGINGDFPPSTTGHEVACGDLLIRRESVPVKTEDVARSSVDFLLHDDYYSHGDPALTNSLALSSEDLTLEDLQVDGDTVTVRLAGDLTTRSDCESYRIRAQLHSTAADAAGVQNAQILLNDVDLDQHLGLTPFELGPEITTPDREPEPEPTSTGGAQGDELGEGSVVDSTDGPRDESTQDPEHHDPTDDQSREVTEPGGTGRPGSTSETTPTP